MKVAKLCAAAFALAIAFAGRPAANGQPTNAVFYARPFGETELLALAKAYQDAAGFHLRKPAKLEA